LSYAVVAAAHQPDRTLQAHWQAETGKQVVADLTVVERRSIAAGADQHAKCEAGLGDISAANKSVAAHGKIRAVGGRGNSATGDERSVAWLEGKRAAFYGEPAACSRVQPVHHCNLNASDRDRDDRQLDHESIQPDPGSLLDDDRSAAERLYLLWIGSEDHAIAAAFQREPLVLLGKRERRGEDIHTRAQR